MWRFIRRECCSVAKSCLTLCSLWTAAHHPSLSFTTSWSLLKLVSIESVMPSNHLILCHPLLLLSSVFPALGSFLMSWFFTSGGQSIGASASASVLPVNIQGWFPFRLTVLIFLFANVFILWDCTVHWGRGYVWFPGPHCISGPKLSPFSTLSTR